MEEIESVMRLLLSSAVASGLCAVLLVAAACNPEAYNQQANKAAPAAGSGVATAPPAVPVQPPDNVRRITVDELQQALAAHQAVLVDVRNDVAYKNGHIKGALLIPATEIDKHLAELPKDKLIVTYCA